MIVCWVLFAIPAIVSLVSWPMYYKYGYDIDALYEEPAPPRDLLDNNNSIDDPDGKSVSPEITFRRQSDRIIRLSNVDQLQALERKQEEWRIAAIAGTLIAAAILLWNILCHTVAWIFAGRKIQQE